MDWIEGLFHVSPDGNNGSLELGIMVGALIGLVMFLAAMAKVIPTVRRWFRHANLHRSDTLRQGRTP